MHKTPKPGTAPRALVAAQTPTQTPSPAPFIGLSPPTSPRRVKNQIRGGAATTTTPRSGDGDDGRTPSSAMATRKPRRGVAASLHDLTHWRRPGRTARVAGGGLYLMLCVGSLRQMPLPAGTVACYAFIFTLAASLFTRLFQRVRRNLGFGLGLGGMDAAAAESKSELTRRRREAHVRLMAAKFGGWVAASAAARAPVAAEAWIYTEAVVRWDSPPATLRACFLLWFTSIVARVWWLSWGYTVALLWCAAFVVPPVVSALGPAAGDAARRAVTWYAGKWLNDRRLQLAIVGFIWSGTGYAGRTLLTLTLVIMFLTGGKTSTSTSGGGANKRREDEPVVEGERLEGLERPGVTVAGGVTIEEMPPSPAAVTTTPLGRVDPNVTRVAGSIHVNGHAGGKHGSPLVVGRDDSAKETTESSAALDDDLDLGRAAGRESPMKTPTAFVASGEKDWSGGGGSAVSAARRRMIADRARRILEGDDSD